MADLLDTVEADAAGTGTPGQTQKKPFPWEKDKDSSTASGGPSSNTSPDRPYPAFAIVRIEDGSPAYSPQDQSDPVLLLARLTMLKAHRNCLVTAVPSDLRHVITSVVRKLEIDNVGADFLRRLLDLQVISKGFHEELRQEDLTPTSGIVDKVLGYIFRAGMMAVLNFTVVLYEDQKYDAVRKILDNIKSRNYLPSLPRPPENKDAVILDDAVSQVKVDVTKGRYHGSSMTYKMSSRPRGHVLIINNENFGSSGQYDDRKGTHIDGIKLANLFTQLGFGLYTERQFQDLPSHGMRELIQSFAAYEDHQNVDACVVCILSHGTEQGKIAGTDGEYITDKLVHDKFTATNCPHLAGKPKIFLFVACRGSAMDNGFEIDVPSPEVMKMAQLSGATDFHITSEVIDGDTAVLASDLNHSVRGVPSRIPNNVDYVSVYATVPGYRSLRSQIYGTWFVQDFVDVVASRAYLTDLVAMVCEVNGRLSERSFEGEKQTLQVVTTLRRNLFLNPGY